MLFFSNILFKRFSALYSISCSLCKSDTEYQDLLLLSKKIMEIDFNAADNKAKEQLKKELLDIVKHNKRQRFKQHRPQQDNQHELTDTELDFVAAGLKTGLEDLVKDKFRD